MAKELPILEEINRRIQFIQMRGNEPHSIIISDSLMNELHNEIEIKTGIKREGDVVGVMFTSYKGCQIVHHRDQFSLMNSGSMPELLITEKH